MEKYLNQPEKLLPKLQSSQKAMDRIAKIVSGLRKFSRTTNGNEKKALNLSLIVTEAITLIEVKARKFSFSISCDVDPQVMIMGDAIEVEQVLINLINNAIDANKFAEEKWINIKGFTTPQHVVLQVIDSGKGISAKVQEKLFQPFFTTKPIGEGTGLGLSIARGILEDHQASIELTSALGAHTCFEIKFPLIENFKVNSHSTAT
jgi:C4-dicarboxylate-specific signal transduction histidine kinase